MLLLCKKYFTSQSKLPLPPFLSTPPSLLPSPLFSPFLREEEASHGYQPILAYHATVGLSASSPNKARQGRPDRRVGSNGRQQSQQQPMLLLSGVSHENPSCMSVTYVYGGLGLSHTYSLVGGSVFVSPYGSRLVVPVGFPMVSLTSLVPSILPLPLPQDSLSCTGLWVSACFHQLLGEAS